MQKNTKYPIFVSMQNLQIENKILFNLKKKYKYLLFASCKIVSFKKLTAIHFDKKFVEEIQRAS